MRILPITNQNNRNTFKSNYFAREAKLVLRNPCWLRKELFSDGISLFYKELAKFDYYNRFYSDGLFKMFQYASNTLRVRDEELRPDIAILEGIRNNNVEYLRVLMERRELVPLQPNGEVSVDVILEGRNHSNPDIRSFFDDRYLEKKTYNRDMLRIEETPPAYTIIEGSDIYREMMGIQKPDLRGEFLKSSSNLWLNKAKQKISNDEDMFGAVKLSTLERIVNHDSFEFIKNESLNISGSKILHLLAEIYINPNNKEEMELLDSIMAKCRKVNYNFNITNDFGETALDKAREAESDVLVQRIKKAQRR